MFVKRNIIPMKKIVVCVVLLQSVIWNRAQLTT